MNNLQMVKEDWEKCEVLVKLLKPLQLIMTIPCSEQQNTMSMVWPLIANLISKHLKINQSEFVFATEFKNSFQRFGKTIFNEKWIFWDHTDAILVNVAQIANLLDPRFKNFKFEPSEQSKFCIQSIVHSKILSVTF